MWPQIEADLNARECSLDDAAVMIVMIAKVIHGREGSLDLESGRGGGSGGGGNGGGGCARGFDFIRG